MITKTELEKKLQGMFDFTLLVSDTRPGGFTVEVKYHDTSFDDLAKLSEAFGTKKINLGSESREGGWCETCPYSYTVNIIRVDEVTRGLE